MNAREFYNLTVKMRAAQKMYFRTRTQSALNESKILERELDAEIERVERITMEQRTAVQQSLDFGE